jgi:hypothetical protein
MAWGRKDVQKGLLEFNDHNLIPSPYGVRAVDCRLRLQAVDRAHGGLLPGERFFSKVCVALREDRPIHQSAFLEELLKVEQV